MNFAVFEETVRRHITHLGFIGFGIVVGLAGVLAATFNTPASLWPSLVSLLAVITGSGLIGPEFSTGTLQLIVSKPVRRTVYVVSRVAGVFVSIMIVALAGAFGELITRSFVGGPLPWRRIAIALASSLTVALLTISILTFLGSVTRAYFNAAIYIGMQAALSTTEAFLGVARFRGRFFGELLDRFHVDEVLISIDDAFFPAAGSAVASDAVLRLAATALVFVALACLMFARREVPYGAD